MVPEDVTIFVESLLKDPWSSSQLVPLLKAEGAPQLIERLTDGSWESLETPVKLRVLLAFLMLPDHANHTLLARLAAAVDDTRDDWVPLVIDLVRERLGLPSPSDAGGSRLETRLSETVSMLRADPGSRAGELRFRTQAPLSPKRLGFASETRT